MNTKAIYAACLFAALNVCTLSARAEAVTPQTYNYGTHLDIKRVVSMSQESKTVCGVVNARMTYLDSHDNTQVLDYLKFGDGCVGDN
ncbi:DUF2790 domain-containing protein [Pseudomonas sp. SDO524_S393]